MLKVHGQGIRRVGSCACERESGLPLHLAFGGLLAIFDISGLVDLRLHLYMVFSQSASPCPSSPFYEDIGRIGSESTRI